METPPPPPPYQSPQRLPEHLIIKEAENFTGENNLIMDAPHNQPLSSKAANTLPPASSVDISFNSNRAHIFDAKMSKRDIDKANYISKEQQIRDHNLGRDQQKYHLSSAYAPRRAPSTRSVGTVQTNKDWTPQDSAYGAAFPFCGWVPKGLRETVERILIGAALITLVYIIVTVGMKLTNGLTRNKTTSSENAIVTDDDFYVEESSYAQMYDDNDDFYEYGDDGGKIR